MTDHSPLMPRFEIFSQLGLANLDAVLWLGAGEAHPEELAALKARQLRLVDPDPSRAAALRRTTQEMRGAEVIEAAAAEAAGRAVLRRYNLSAANALRTPSGLRELFPNLRQTAELEVETLDMTCLLEGLKLAQDRNHLLILETPGEITALLGALAEPDLAAFSHLLLPVAPQPLYEGEAPGADLLARLTGAGFVIEGIDGSDPDRPLAYLARDKARMALEAARDQWQARTHEAEEVARTLRSDFEAKAQALTRAQAQIAAEAKAHQEALAKLRAEAEANQNQLQARAEAAAKHHADEMAKLCSERDGATQAAHRLREERATLRAQIKTLQGQTGSVERLQDNLGVALRMQALRETDLAELRSRYTAQARETAALDQMLRDLAEDVQIALAHLDAEPSAQTPASAATPGLARRRAARKAAATAEAEYSRKAPETSARKPTGKKPAQTPSIGSAP